MRILVVGLGAIGQRHVRNLCTLYGDEIELHAYRARGLGRVLTDQMTVQAEQGLDQTYNIHAHTDFAEALALKPDAVLICNPSSFHLATARQAAEQGAHLFIEKPLSDSLAGVDDLIAIVRAQNLSALVGYQMRFHPVLCAAHELITQNALGRIVAVRAVVGEYLPFWHKYEDYRATYGARRDLGGGALVSQIHEFDYLYWFFGMPRCLWSVGGHLSNLEIDVEDVASTLMQYDSDGIRFPVHLQQDYLQRPPARGCQIVGDMGKLEIDLLAPSLRQYDAAGQLSQSLDFPNFVRNQLFLSEMEHFIACVRGQAQPLVNLEQGAASLRMALAARESLERGGIVNL